MIRYVITSKRLNDEINNENRFFFVPHDALRIDEGTINHPIIVESIHVWICSRESVIRSLRMSAYGFLIF